MSKQLLILRHGKSDWLVDVDDFHRPLKKRGVRAAQKIGSWFLDNPASAPDYVISSPATRAVETARITTVSAGLESPLTDRRIYGADVGALLSIIAEVPENIQHPMIVGHNPGLEELLLYLCDIPDSYYKDWKLLTTGTLAIVEINSAWNELKEKSGVIENLIRGRDL